MSLLIIFVVLSIVNVIFSTVRSILTIKGGKAMASIISGGYFAFYNVMLIYTVMNFPMWQKCLITFVCNVVGVWIVKFIEEKMKKDKLWLVKVTVPTDKAERMIYFLNLKDIPFTYYNLNKYYVFDCFCDTQADTAIVTDLCKMFDGKMFATENKLY